MRLPGISEGISGQGPVGRDPPGADMCRSQRQGRCHPPLGRKSAVHPAIHPLRVGSHNPRHGVAAPARAHTRRGVRRARLSPTHAPQAASPPGKSTTLAWAARAPTEELVQQASLVPEYRGARPRRRHRHLHLPMEARCTRRRPRSWRVTPWRYAVPTSPACLIGISHRSSGDRAPSAPLPS